MSTDLDIVVPVYEAKHRLNPLLQRLEDWVKINPRKVHLILIEDGSNESIEHELSELSTLIPITYIKLAQNYGQHTATAIGLSQSKAPMVATLDDDLQHDPFELEKLIERSEKSGGDLIYGKYERKRQKWWKSLGGKLVNLLFQLENPYYKDVSSFRLMRAEVLSILKQHKSPTYLVDEYLLRAASKKETVIVKHRFSERNYSNYNAGALFSFAIRLLIFHSSVPLKLIIRLGLLIALSCIFLAFYFIYMKYTYGAVLGFSALIVAILFSTSLLMVTLGIIGEYIKKIWQGQMKLNEVVIAYTKKVDEKT
jgi:undecaprenyl-phosphate 4-deoxy-4-formamido-L-arabinose transferase